MAAQHSSALRATPLRILTLDKSGKRMLLDKGEALDETRAVMLLIPCVDSLQASAREGVTLITKPNSMIQEELTSFLEKRALPITGATSRAIRHSHPLTSHVVFARKITATHRTVHAARRDQFRIIRKGIEHAASEGNTACCSHKRSYP